MKLEVDLNKRFVIVIAVISLIIVGIVGVVAYSAAGTGGDPVNFGHSVNEIDWSQSITKNVSATGFCIGTVCVDDWEDISGGIGVSSRWKNQTETSNIYFDEGNVGIGTTTPSAKLEVVGGPINASGGLIIPDESMPWSKIECVGCINETHIADDFEAKMIGKPVCGEEISISAGQGMVIDVPYNCLNSVCYIFIGGASRVYFQLENGRWWGGGTNGDSTSSQI
ncbi:unnamed protein product, partial [marine sediment metagenome]